MAAGGGMVKTAPVPAILDAEVELPQEPANQYTIPSSPEAVRSIVDVEAEHTLSSLETTVVTLEGGAGAHSVKILSMAISQSQFEPRTAFIFMLTVFPPKEDRSMVLEFH